MGIAAYILGFCAVLFGAMVILFRNPLNSALSLVMNLVCVAGLYVTLNAHFLAVVQIAVYAGAIMVLVLFVLMLLDVKDEIRGSAWYLRLGVLSLVVVAVLCRLIPSLIASTANYDDLKLMQNAIDANGSAYNIGLLLFNDYVTQFELASLIIMVGIVGAVMIAKRRTDPGAEILK